jgi:hypothetical protein
MPETIGSLKGHAALAACLTLMAAALAAAQQPPQPVVSETPPAPEFISRYDFHLSANAIAINDPRFSWDTHFGGSLDLVDYILGRAGIVADYEAVLGDEFRLFDPNQGNYTLEASASGRVGASTEAVGFFHHVSRHLSDRPKRPAIAWNVLGARVLHQAAIRGTRIDVDLEGGKVVQHAYVDYDWTAGLHLQASRPVANRLRVFGRARAEWFGVTGEVLGRGRQAGGAVEAGLHVKGGAGALELFAGFERRVDADPFDRQPQNWAIAGFRLLSR